MVVVGGGRVVVGGGRVVVAGGSVVAGAEVVGVVDEMVVAVVVGAAVVAVEAGGLVVVSKEVGLGIAAVDDSVEPRSERASSSLSRCCGDDVRQVNRNSPASSRPTIHFVRMARSVGGFLQNG